VHAKVKEVLNSILHRFKIGDIPKAIAYSMFPIPNIPAAKWSLCNRTLMFFAGTQDARGFNMWKKANRYVKKGAKAFCILAPRFVKKENGEGEEKKFLAGFLAVSVFKLEDTEGEPLDYQQIQLPELPLMDIARQWGLSVKAIPGNYRCYGYYSDGNKEIALATEEETVFFHELSHAAHAKILGKFKTGQDWKQEIVAELSAAVLCRLMGRDGDKYLGNNYAYIDGYASKAKIPALTACFQVIADVEKVLQRILIAGAGDNNNDRKSENEIKGVRIAG
jgi:antirestriction protein ArdC